MFAGLWGVVMTDVIHFFAAMVGFIVLAVIVVVKNDGPAQMVQNIVNTPNVNLRCSTFSQILKLPAGWRYSHFSFISDCCVVVGVGRWHCNAENACL
jgi:Na+/proline symporter